MFEVHWLYRCSSRVAKNGSVYRLEFLDENVLIIRAVLTHEPRDPWSSNINTLHRSIISINRY